MSNRPREIDFSDLGIDGNMIPDNLRLTDINSNYAHFSSEPSKLLSCCDETVEEIVNDGHRELSEFAYDMNGSIQHPRMRHLDGHPERLYS